MNENREYMKFRARELRKQETDQEKHLWYDFLKSYPVHFRRQKVLGNYIVDFYCHQAKLAIELDGSQHYTPEGMEYDRNRTAYLNQLGIEVVRYSNRQISEEFRAVCENIDFLVCWKLGIRHG